MTNIEWDTKVGQVRRFLADNGFVVGFMRNIHVLSGEGRLLATPLAVVCGLTYNFLPFMTLPLYASLERIDGRLVEAATDLYSSPFTAFRKVTWPLSMPGVVSASLIVFAWTFSAFATPELLGGGRVKMIANVVKDLALDSFNWPGSAAFAIVALAVTLALVTGLGRLLTPRAS